MAGDNWNDPGTKTAFKNTGIAVVTTTGLGAIHPLAAGAQLVGGLVYEVYTNEYGASTTRLVSPTTPSTIEGVVKYFKDL